MLARFLRNIFIHLAGLSQKSVALHVCLYIQIKTVDNNKVKFISFYSKEEKDDICPIIIPCKEKTTKKVLLRMYIIPVLDVRILSHHALHALLKSGKER